MYMSSINGIVYIKLLMVSISIAIYRFFNKKYLKSTFTVPYILLLSFCEEIRKLETQFNKLCRSIKWRSQPWKIELSEIEVSASDAAVFDSGLSEQDKCKRTDLDDIISEMTN